MYFQFQNFLEQLSFIIQFITSLIQIIKIANLNVILDFIRYFSYFILYIIIKWFFYEKIHYVKWLKIMLFLRRNF